jgi:pyruvate dehydrogenase E1 component subunit alpha
LDDYDVLAVYEATCEAVERARAGDGPTFIEAVTYRAAPHATADDPRLYIDPERVEEARAAEPVARFEGYLRRRGVLDDAAAESIRGEAAELMRRGIAEAEAAPPGDASLIFEHAYAAPPPELARDLDELRRLHGG